MTGVRVAYAALAIAQLAIGAAAIFARYALTAAGPLAVSTLRLALASIPVVIAALVRERRALPLRVEVRLAVAGIALAVHFATWIASLGLTTVAISTLLVCTTPLWLGLYDALVRRERTSAAFWYGLVLTLLGIAAIGGAGGSLGPHAPAGDALALAGAVMMAVYLAIVRSLRDLPTLAVIGRTYPYAAIVLALGAGAAHEPPPPLTAAGAWLGIVAMALVSQGLGHTGLNIAVRSLPARIVAITILLEPVIAAVLAALLFGEGLGPRALAGALAVLAGIALAIRGEGGRGGD